MYHSFIKDFLDFLFSVLAIILFLPIFSFIFIIIKLENPLESAFYTGERIGKNDKPFKMYKFKTMKKGSEKYGFSTALGDERLTKIGSFLRKYKLDELPQFINVLRGNMSFVGPRPQVSFYTDKYNSQLKKILSVKPGITDLASIYFSDMDAILGEGNVENKYANEIEPKKNILRLRYVENRSFSLDSKIFLTTVLMTLGIKKSFFTSIDKLNDVPKI